MRVFSENHKGRWVLLISLLALVLLPSSSIASKEVQLGPAAGSCGPTAGALQAVGGASRMAIDGGTQTNPPCDGWDKPCPQTNGFTMP